MKTNNKGFTLIEMLVVVAIVGILSAVVLTALGPSRAKARDARVISGVNQVRVLAEIYFSNHGNSYAGLESVNSTNWPAEIKAIGTDITSQGGDLQIRTGGSTQSPAFTAYSKLSSSPTIFYCVDATGAAGQRSNPDNNTVCPAS